MKNNQGFIELKNVNDYWKKLQSDYDDLKDNDEDVYLAFNFFITSYHLIDWIFKGKISNERRKLIKAPILKICGHIANGIKHFSTDQHKSVKEIEKEGYVEQGYVEDGYFESPIMIYLEEDLISEFGESIKITDLADRVMTFWRNELSVRNLIE